MRRELTPEERQARSERMKAYWAERRLEKAQTETHNSVDRDEGTTPEIAVNQSTLELRAQIKELQETQALFKALLLNRNQDPQPNQGVDIGRGNKLVGEVEKYLVDPANYPDPTPRLAKEPQLAVLAFNHNYELEYTVAVSSYETKTGINMKEPKFMIQLNRVVLGGDGQPTNKRYIARKLVFHEDPQSAIVIARENGIEIDQTNQKAFLNEMRYIRVRDWLFGIFWPKPVQPESQIREEVIGGTIVQVFTKNSEESSGVDFDKLTTKIV